MNFNIAQSHFGVDPNTALWCFLIMPLIAAISIVYALVQALRGPKKPKPPANDRLYLASTARGEVRLRPATTPTRISPRSDGRIRPSAGAPSSSSDDGFGTSMALGMLTDNVPLSAIVGGSVLGAVVGAELSDEFGRGIQDNSSQAPCPDPTP